MTIFLESVCYSVSYSYSFEYPLYNASQKYESTLIHIYVLNEFLIAYHSFCVQIGQIFVVQWLFENFLKTVKSLFLNENVVNFEFFIKFKVSLCLKGLTNLVAKGAKRSVKMWATNIYKSFWKSFFPFFCSWTVKNWFSTYCIMCICTLLYE